MATLGISGARPCGPVAPPPGEAGRLVAAAFAREFARLGYPAAHILRLFADPFYGGAHAALCRLGEPAIREIVEDAVRSSPRVGRLRPSA
ncbi:MAG TPA: hypothetical protein VKA21_05115 [Candidatus Binatia bacterium]|nr:hypothetical protein [Candidatus Binatia bacterium]